MSERDICDCTEVDEPVDHDAWCQLWMNNDFRRGTGIWSKEYFRVVHVTEWMDMQSPDFTIQELVEQWPGRKRLLETANEEQEDDTPISMTSAGLTPHDAALAEVLEEIEEAEDDYIECPECHQLDVLCSMCGFQTDDCECPGGPPEFYCPACSHIFEFAVEAAEGEIEHLPSPMDEPRCTCKPEKSYYCHVCGVTREFDEEPWEWFTEDGTEKEEKPPVGPATCTCTPPKLCYCQVCGVVRTNKSDPWRWSCIVWELDKGGRPIKKAVWEDDDWSWGSDRHYEEKVTFPDGTVVLASSVTTRKPGESAPDFGLYLDTSWKAACLAYMVAWPDFGLPSYREIAADAIVDVFEKAQAGLSVEVGCIGGHGRTGTALACMAVLAGVEPTDAVEWIRKNYCTHAVESLRQEWYVEWFADLVFGTNNAGPEPQEPKKIYSGSFGGVTKYQAKAGGSGKAGTAVNTTTPSKITNGESKATSATSQVSDVPQRFQVPAACLRPDCVTQIPFLDPQCPTCNLLYAPGFWRNHVDHLEELEKIKASSSPAGRVVGEIKGDFAWTGESNGWQHLSVVSHYIAGFGQGRQESKRERKRRLHREKQKQQNQQGGRK